MEKSLEKRVFDLLKQSQDVINELSNENKGLKEVVKEFSGENKELKEVNKTMIRAFESSDLIDMKECAKTLNYKGFGRNTIFAMLRDLNILMRNNEPYQKYVNREYFEMLETQKIDSYNNVRIFTKTMITQKGLDFIRRQLDEYTN